MNTYTKHQITLFLDEHYYNNCFLPCILHQAIKEPQRKLINLYFDISIKVKEFREFIIGKTEHEATSQNNIIYSAMKYAKMVQAKIVKEYDINAKGGAKFEYIDNKNEKDVDSFDSDLPIPFKLKDFKFHINNIQGKKEGTDNPLAPSDSTRKSVDGILKKIEAIMSNPQLYFMMKEHDDDTLEKVLFQFFCKFDNNTSLKIIDISGLPNEVAGVLNSMIARLLFQFKLSEYRAEREQNPVLLICEEAHRYVPNSGEAQYREAQSAIRRIAKEGRKYGIGLMLVSQRPSDVESTVLSQCNTWVVLKLNNSNDKNFVSSYMPDNNANLVNVLSSLNSREAVVVGEAISMPSRIKIRKLSKDQLPESDDINFVKGWLDNENNQESIIKSVVERWTKI